MKLAALALTLLPALAIADYDIWEGTCSTGLNPIDPEIFTVISAQTGDFACGSGCSLSVIPGGYSGDPLVYQEKEDGNLDNVVESTGISVGYCEPQTGPNEACTEVNYACSYVCGWHCITGYCG